MRLFIALNISKEAKDYLFKLKEEFRNLGKINLLGKNKYHITLKFLGEVKEDKLEEIKNKLSKVKFNSFEISLNELGHFHERVLWVNTKPKDKILDLAKKIDEQLIEFPNEKDFNNHITLARIKSLKNKKEFHKKLETEIKEIKFKVNSFELMKSTLSKDGAKYEIIHSYTFHQ